MYALNTYQTNDKKKLVPYLYWAKSLTADEIAFFLGFDFNCVIHLLEEDWKIRRNIYG